MGTLVFGAAIVVAVSLAVVIAQRSSIHRMGGPEQARAKLRGGGVPFLTLQGFIDPRCEHVIQASEQQKSEDDEAGDDGECPPESEIRADLHDSLCRSPVDIEEVRRHLSTAHRAGLDWNVLFRETVDRILSEQPYRAPSLPPIERVRPRSTDCDE